MRDIGSYRPEMYGDSAGKRAEKLEFVRALVHKEESGQEAACNELPDPNQPPKALGGRL